MYFQNISGFPYLFHNIELSLRQFLNYEIIQNDSTGARQQFLLQCFYTLMWIAQAVIQILLCTIDSSDWVNPE